MSIQQFLDPELEHQGVLALRQWRFSPAKLEGEPIDVRVEIEMTFTLK